jgi:hypothetical protein
MRQGHSLALYCYREPEGIPEGVEVRDAADVLPDSAVIRHQGGSVALFSDHFRFELQRRGLGTWIDTDNYFIRPIDMKRAYLFGRQVLTPPARFRRAHELIAVGVLRLPPDSPMLTPLLAQFDGRTVPDWLSWRSFIAAKVRTWITGRSDLARLPWGTAGPFAVSALAERFGVSSQALPPDAFNPAPWFQARWILDPAVKLEDMITERTVGVHLWNELIKPFKNEPAPEGSFLQRLQREGA